MVGSMTTYETPAWWSQESRDAADAVRKRFSELREIHAGKDIEGGVFDLEYAKALDVLRDSVRHDKAAEAVKARRERGVA